MMKQTLATIKLFQPGKHAHKISTFSKIVKILGNGPLDDPKRTSHTVNRSLSLVCMQILEITPSLTI